MKIILASILLALPFLLSGCASDQPKDPNTVSSMPWNRPEQWEGQGPMGAFAPQSH